MEPFSVLMSVYARESAGYLRQSLESVMGQDPAPDQVVLVQDGPIGGELRGEIESWQRRLGATLTLVSLAENKGLGVALDAGLRACVHDTVARMDADDICCPSRFRRQLSFLEDNTGVAVLGGQIEEFDPERPASRSVRSVPLSHEEISRVARQRNPFNHMTVMLRRRSAVAAGGYRHFPGFEDYFLWARMIARGDQMANLPHVLVRARTGGNFFERRGGWRYVRHEVALQLAFHRSGFISVPVLARNVMVRAAVRLLPGGVRAKLYRELLRADLGEESSEVVSECG